MGERQGLREGQGLGQGLGEGLGLGQRRGGRQLGGVDADDKLALEVPALRAVDVRRGKLEGQRGSGNGDGQNALAEVGKEFFALALLESEVPVRLQPLLLHPNVHVRRVV